MSLKKNVIANYIGHGWLTVMNLIFVPYYIKYLGIEAYGIIGFYSILQTILTIMDLGMSSTINLEMSRLLGGTRDNISTKNLLRTLELIFFSLATIFVLTFYQFSEWFATNWLNAQNLSVATISNALKVIALVAALRFIESLYKSAIIGLQKQVSLNTLYSIMTTIRCAGALFVVAYIKPTIYAYFIWQAISSAATLVFLIILLYKFLPFKNKIKAHFSTKELKRIWKFAAGVMATTFISLFFTQFDKLLLSKILSLKDFGNYSFAVMISNILIVMINPINQAHFPKYSELISKNNKKKLITVFHQATQLAISICGTAAFVLFFFGDKLISAWSQNFTLATSTFPILKILIIGSFFYCIHRIVFSILLAHGWSNLTTRINVIGITFFIPTMLWASFSYQALGAAWAWLVLNFGIFILSSIIFFKRALKSEKNKWYITDILIPASSSFLTLLCFSFLINNFANQILQVIFIIIFSTIAFSISLICSIDLRIIIKNYFYALKNYLAK